MMCRHLRLNAGPIDIMSWYAMMMGCWYHMNETERAELLQWERTHLGYGDLGTSDWPGWAQWLPPKPPLAPRQPTPKRKPISDARRMAVYARDQWRCRRCGTPNNLSIDHITPVSRGGTNEFDNLQTLCRSCNSSKRDRVEEARP